MKAKITIQINLYSLFMHVCKSKQYVDIAHFKDRCERVIRDQLPLRFADFHARDFFHDAYDDIQIQWNESGKFSFEHIFDVHVQKRYTSSANWQAEEELEARNILRIMKKYVVNDLVNDFIEDEQGVMHV